jgi:excisionase family DNA binding protein
MRTKTKHIEAPVIILPHLPQLKDIPAEFMSVPDAATFLRLSDVTIRRLLTQRKLTRYKASGRTLLSAAEVRAFVHVE